MIWYDVYARAKKSSNNLMMLKIDQLSSITQAPKFYTNNNNNNINNSSFILSAFT